MLDDADLEASSPVPPVVVQVVCSTLGKSRFVYLGADVCRQ